MDDKQVKALRIIHDLLCYGNPTTPNASPRHQAYGFSRFDQAFYTSTILHSEPPQLKIVWHGDNHRRLEEARQQVADTLSQRKMGATYDHASKTLRLTLEPEVYAALDKLDVEFKQVKALRIMEDLLRYGNSSMPYENLRHRISGFVRFDQAPHTGSILPTEPPQLEIVWHGENHLRPEEVGRQVFESLCQRKMGATYERHTKTLRLTLKPEIYTALDALDKDLQPLRAAAPAVTIGTPTPAPDGKITPSPDNEIVK